MTDKNSLESLFDHQDIFNQALTHKSWVNEHPGIRASNERLEFLGDAVLEFIVSKEIYRLFPEREEGYLTALRANLVNTVNLSELAQTLELGNKLFLSKGEEDTGGRTNQSLLANTVEAIIGALFLDKGLGAVEKFIEENILANIDKKIQEPLKDSKSLLQEFIQAEGHPAPHYEVVSESGPDHAKHFTISVVVDGKSLAKGLGKNKSEAAQEAAKEALKKYVDK